MCKGKKKCRKCQLAGIGSTKRRRRRKRQSSSSNSGVFAWVLGLGALTALGTMLPNFSQGPIVESESSGSPDIDFS